MIYISQFFFTFQLKERKPLMILFSEEAIGCIHRAAIINANNIDEKFYLFLKKLTQVFNIFTFIFFR